MAVDINSRAGYCTETLSLCDAHQINSIVWNVYMLVRIYGLIKKHCGNHNQIKHKSTTISNSDTMKALHSLKHYNQVMMGAMASQITSIASVTQPFIQARTKENIKVPRHWPLWGEFTSNRWIPHANGRPVTRKMFSFDDFIMNNKHMLVPLGCPLHLQYYIFCRLLSQVVLGLGLTKTCDGNSFRR